MFLCFDVFVILFVKAFLLDFDACLARTFAVRHPGAGIASSLPPDHQQRSSEHLRRYQRRHLPSETAIRFPQQRRIDISQRAASSKCEG
ncbi:unnamed protein product [Soboliphyme baturini]|uniref:Secreted protein n=1 Tax=Soboliphyme baturini TaxID=241478 RepID=A0A183ISQ9_9BILA|nr:unnamed protein product [Soboliphyme baturini]